MQKFGKCTNCDKEVEAPNFQCATGEQHVVESKRYYMDDCPSDPGAREPGTYRPLGIPQRDSRTMICNLVPARKQTLNHEIIEVPGRNVEFIRGTYETADPEEQYYLEKRKGLCSKERWEQVYLTDQQRLDMERAEVAAEKRRLEVEKNDLLSKVKRERVTA